MDLKDYFGQITEQIDAKLPKKLAPNYRILRNYIIFDIFYNYVFMSKDYTDLKDYFLSLCLNHASAWK